MVSNKEPIQSHLYFCMKPFYILSLPRLNRVTWAARVAAGLLVHSVVLVYSAAGVSGRVSGRCSHLRQSLFCHSAGGDCVADLHFHQSSDN